MRLLEREFPYDHLPLLRWLIFTGVCTFGVALALHYGLFHLMLASDKTYISAIIGVLYVFASLHCLVRTAAISRGRWKELYFPLSASRRRLPLPLRNRRRLFPREASSISSTPRPRPRPRRSLPSRPDARRPS